MLNSSMPRLTVRGRIAPLAVWCCRNERNPNKNHTFFHHLMTADGRTYRCLCPTIWRLRLQKMYHRAGAVEDDSFAAGQRDLALPIAGIRCLTIFLLQLFGHLFFVWFITRIFSFVKPRTTPHIRLFALPINGSTFSLRYIHIAATAIGYYNIRFCINSIWFALFVNKFCRKNSISQQHVTFGHERFFQSHRIIERERHPNGFRFLNFSVEPMLVHRPIHDIRCSSGWRRNQSTFAIGYVGHFVVVRFCRFDHKIEIILIVYLILLILFARK